jgi:hypothetical protein
MFVYKHIGYCMICQPLYVKLPGHRPELPGHAVASRMRAKVVLFHIVPLPACGQAGTPPLPLWRDGARPGQELKFSGEQAKIRGALLRICGGSRDRVTKTIPGIQGQSISLLKKASLKKESGESASECGLPALRSDEKILKTAFTWLISSV